METTMIKTQVKKLIDTLDDDKAMQVYEYARNFEHSRCEHYPSEISDYFGKLDLDIELDVLRGRNDFN